MAASYKEDYFGLPRIVSAILAFFFGSLIGGIQRVMEGNAVAGIVRIICFFFFVGFIINIVDLVLILLNGKMWRVL